MSGACLPRRAKLPTDLKESISGDFVYLPKNVLFGEVYDFILYSRGGVMDSVFA